MFTTFLRRVLAILDVGSLPQPPIAASDDTAFREYARALTLRNMKIAVLCAFLANLLWWLTDQAVFRGQAAVMVPVTWGRGVLTAASLLTYAALRSPVARRLPLVATAVVGVIAGLFIGHFVGQRGGLEMPWFHLSYVVFSGAVLVIVKPALRLWFTSILPVFLVVGFALARPQWTLDPWLPATLSYLVFVTLMTTIAGHLFYVLLRQSFFNARAQKRTARALEELNATLEERVREQTRELRMLASHLENAREDERTRISRELHDELGQELAALRYAVTFLKQRYERDPTSVRKNLGELESLVQRTTTTTRQIVAELRPKVLDDLGLEAGLEWLLKQTEERTGVRCHFVTRSRRFDVDAEVSIAAFRIIQESLTNTIRHAKATRVDVEVSAEGDELSVTVRDNGVGLPESRATGKDPERRGGMGIIGMRERAEALGGRFRIEGPPGQGTTVHVTLPLTSKAVRRST